MMTAEVFKRFLFVWLAVFLLLHFGFPLGWTAFEDLVLSFVTSSITVYLVQKSIK